MKKIEFGKKFVNIISLENIGFKYDFNSKSSSLQNISLNIKRGEMVGIIGKSGSGFAEHATLSFLCEAWGPP